MGGGGTGATATVADLTNGMVTGLTGAAALAIPLLLRSSSRGTGGGCGAYATANLLPTTVASITLINGGSGYTTPPTVIIASAMLTAPMPPAPL